MCIYQQDSNLHYIQPIEVTLAQRHLNFFYRSKKQQKFTGQVVAGVEPDNLAGFTTSLFLPSIGDEVTFVYGILCVILIKQGKGQKETVYCSNQLNYSGLAEGRTRTCDL